ncbi:SOS response-associated peptidase family protein [Sphingomonas immobilis]|uniref:SOS response-associated peptidase family protein n=1 Tax=Sphingomonas immobilis TaxID=3063997 RepID=A0ABT8ZY41_9SPHN|nr:SOS response-associated peptidase family protein [Sphingomonas sp. CA1-15]MDO7841925.1 SOS response-associated peptidase family protein [Sphingomonas sp. CA1-15]
MANRTTHADRIGNPGAVIRRGRDLRVEMVNLIWGLEPAWPQERPFEAVRAEGRTFPTNRCLVPASEFFHTRRGQRYRFTRVDGDWFYLAGIWRPARPRWSSAYATLTIDSNDDVRAYAERQMVVVHRDRRMDWLDALVPETEILRALPTGTFKAELWDDDALAAQPALAL